MPFKLFAHARPSAMEEHPLISLAHFQGFADLLGAAAGHVAQGDHDPLGVGQLVYHASDEIDRLSCEQP